MANTTTNSDPEATGDEAAKWAKHTEMHKL
jgi:hypothetical protein